ncbi:MAG: DUF433 domain-containing protein [Candidatus Heimdallarchaeota archaeon]
MTTPLPNERIEKNSKVLDGEAVLKGTRISVNFLIVLVRNDWSKKHILENYPALEPEDIRAAIDYIIEQYTKLIQVTLTKWNETSAKLFLQKARDGRHENAENDAIELRQFVFEIQSLSEKRREYE